MKIVGKFNEIVTETLNEKLRKSWLEHFITTCAIAIDRRMQGKLTPKGFHSKAQRRAPHAGIQPKSNGGFQPPCAEYARTAAGFQPLHTVESSRIGRLAAAGSHRYERGLRTKSTSWFIVFAFLFGVSSVSAAEPFEAFLKKHCVRCHGPQKEEGDIRIDRLSRV